MQGNRLGADVLRVCDSLIGAQSALRRAVRPVPAWRVRHEYLALVTIRLELAGSRFCAGPIREQQVLRDGGCDCAQAPSLSRPATLTRCRKVAVRRRTGPRETGAGRRPDQECLRAGWECRAVAGGV